MLAALLPASAQAADPLGAEAVADDNPGYDATWCPAVSGDGLRDDCMMNGDGSVRVSWGGVDGGITQAAARSVLQDTWEGMRRYVRLGFTAAAISQDRPVVIAVEAGDGDPYYSWKSGVVYIGAGAAEKLKADDASALLELWHELFHWIQDEGYVMGAAAVSGEATWWMETGAEVATFLIADDAAERNARLYGHSTSGPVNVSQLAPHQWPAKELYQHAQRLLSSMCPGASCALSVKEFAKAVNDGTYILDDAGRRGRFSKGIDDYARYLLTGSLDHFGTVEPIATGTAFGDYIVVQAEAKPGVGMRLTGTNDKPQIDRDAGTVHAVMEPDSVYALAVVSGKSAMAWTGATELGTAPAGWPAVLTIEKGPAFYYRVDGGPVLQHDGASELVFAPIQETHGIGNVRIVAVAKDSGATFKARIEEADLEGDWVFRIAGKAKLVSSTCEISKSQAATTKDDLLLFFTQFAARRGTFVKTDLGLRWAQQAKLVLDKKIPPLQYDATLRIGEKLSGDLSIELSSKPKASGSLPLVFAVALVPFGLLPLARRRRRIVAGLVLLAMAGLLGGCVGIGNLELAIKSDMSFTRLEYTGPGAPKAAEAQSAKTAKAKAKTKVQGPQPTWILSGGRTTLTLDLDVEASIQGKTQKRRCNVVASLPIDAEHYPDGVLKEPKLPKL